MKIIGLLMVFSGCTLFGVILDVKYKRRIKELKTFILGFERLYGSVAYYLTPLAEGCIEVSSYLGHGIDVIFKTFGDDLEARKSLDTYELWKQAIQRENYRYHLKQEDYELLYEFGRRIGNFDKNTQQQNIEYIINQLNQRVEQLEVNSEKTSKMYTGLSILVGACICILLI